MSEKGQGVPAARPGGQQAGPPGGGNQAQPGVPPPGSDDMTDAGGQKPTGRQGGGGGGGGAQQPERPQQPMSGEIEFEDGTRLAQDEQGNVRYRDQQGRTGLWKGGDRWVDEATGGPMPADFEPKTPGDHIGRVN
ncbi:MAG TPA: hypothetical protein VML96_11625 [Egibacteraceae bacterium]|nr:hypothetical protein [Egibacteraceae bacterium]